MNLPHPMSKEEEVDSKKLLSQNEEYCFKCVNCKCNNTLCEMYSLSPNLSIIKCNELEPHHYYQPRKKD